MPWIILFVAGLFEVVWAVGLKQLNSSAPLWLWAGTIAAVIGSMGLLSIAMKEIPIGTAYAIWTGIGAVGTVIVGVLFFQDSVNATRIVSVLLVLAGLIGLRLSS